MSDPSILFVKPKAINAKDKKALQQIGVVVVEVENVADVKFTRAHADISTDGLTKVAIGMIRDHGTDSMRVKFATAMCDAILAKSKPSAGDLYEGGID